MGVLLGGGFVNGVLGEWWMQIVNDGWNLKLKWGIC